jgi:hypothetical protein
MSRCKLSCERSRQRTASPSEWLQAPRIYPSLIGFLACWAANHRSIRGARFSMQRSSRHPSLLSRPLRIGGNRVRGSDEAYLDSKLAGAVKPTNERQISWCTKAQHDSPGSDVFRIRFGRLAGRDGSSATRAERQSRICGARSLAFESSFNPDFRSCAALCRIVASFESMKQRWSESDGSSV